MRTKTAMLAHPALGLAQVGTFAATGALPWWAELLIQVGLVIGQGFIARANGNSDQNGNALPGA